MDNFAISWRLRKTLACAGIFAYLILALAQYFLYDPYEPESNAWKSAIFFGDLITLGIIVICCNGGARPEHKKTATWMAIGLGAIVLPACIYSVFVWEYQGAYSVKIINIIRSVEHICMVLFFVLMIAFSGGGMRIFFGCFALLYTCCAICDIYMSTVNELSSYFPVTFFYQLDNVKIPFLFLGAIIPLRRDIPMGIHTVSDKPLRHGVWGYVFISILCVFVAYLGFTTDYLADTFRYNGADFYNSLEHPISGRLFETYIWTKVSWALYALVMMSLTLMAMFINSRKGYKANAVIIGVTGGLIVMVSLLAIFINPMSFNFSSIATALTAIYSLIVFGCSLVTIWVTKSPVKHDTLKYLAFGAAYFLLYFLLVHCLYNERCRDCLILMLGMLMYIPAGLKYACPRIPAAANMAITGTIMVLTTWLLSTGVDNLLRNY